MQVPALIDATGKRTPYQPEVEPPGRMHGVADRENVGGAIRDEDTGTGSGQLHDVLGVVGDRVLHALVRRCDPERSRVVIGAVVQAGDTVAAGSDHPGDERRTVGTEARLRGLDLDLELQPRYGVPALEGLDDEDHRIYLLPRGHLRQRDHEAVADRAWLPEEENESPDASTPGRRFQGLDAQAVVRGLPVDREGLSCRDRCGVLFVVRPIAVTVLEVDAEVLDRLAGQLGPH